MNDKRQLDAELTALLAHMPGWQLDPRYNDHTWCAVLRDGTGRGIHVNSTQAKGRLYLSGIWPSDDRQKCIPDKPQHITVARNKPPEKIAADLQRRFLPWYMAAYAEQEARVNGNNAARTRRQELAVELCALLGEDARRAMQSKVPHVYSHGLTVDVNGADSVTIQLRYVSAKIAKAVLKAIVKAGGLSD